MSLINQQGLLLGCRVQLVQSAVQAFRWTGENLHLVQLDEQELISRHGKWLWTMTNIGPCMNLYTGAATH